MPKKRIIKTFKTDKITVADVMEVILDINNYTNFIPHCIYSNILEETKQRKIAKLIIAFAGFKIPYISEINFNKEEVFVTEYDKAKEKTFNHLENIWKIEKEESNIKINFFVDFEIKSKLLNILAGKMLGIISEVILNSFIKRLSDKKGEKLFF